MADTQRPSEQSSEPPTPIEKAPFAWLDDNDRAAGAFSPEVTMGYGAFFLLLAVGGVIVMGFTWDGSVFWAGVFDVLLFAAIGGTILRMGVARRSWRRRHPGVDPLSTVPSPTGGSAFGPDTRFGRFFRVVLLVLCWGFAAVLLLAFPAVLGRSDPSLSSATWVASIVILIGLTVLFVLLGWFDLKRIRQIRRDQTSHGRPTKHGDERTGRLTGG